MSIIPSAPVGRRLGRGLVAVALAAWALPAAASATTVSIDNNGTLRYFDGRGATNNLFARVDGGAILITDTARVDPVSFAPGSIAHLCTRVNTSTVRCPFDAGPVTIKRFSVRMGDGNDSARVHVLSVPAMSRG
jgi:ribosomal protein L16/L10AE